MSKIFTSGPGDVVRVDDPQSNGVVGIVTVPGLGSTKICITRVTIAEQTNVQFLHTLGNFIYIYVFGDRIGQLGISGLAFHKACDGGGDIGLQEALRFYHNKKVTKTGSPLTITIGTGTSLTAFLVGSHFDVVDPQAKICQFDLTFALVPEA